MNGIRFLKILAITLLGVALTLLALVWTDAVAPGLAGPDEAPEAGIEASPSPTD